MNYLRICVDDNLNISRKDLLLLALWNQASIDSFVTLFSHSLIEMCRKKLCIQYLTRQRPVTHVSHVKTQQSNISERSICCVSDADTSPEPLLTARQEYCCPPFTHILNIIKDSFKITPTH